MKKHIRECADALRAEGFEVVSFDFTRRHPRATVRYGDQVRAIHIAGTPRSASNEPIIVVQRARRLFGIKGEEGTTSKRRYRRTAAEAEIRVPVLQADTRTDYRDALAKHAHYPAVLSMRAEKAFSNFWRDICIELFGAPSITALYMGRN